ncbi:purine-nucleoside phosphorylase [Micavibrio aeruginosavorus]|uniref:Purine nucleoside phosphorylase n=1 Tax=Micavibrio aeruginosavorus EPB TaxID=349215 RepID=M4VKK7_9BACT|nr:purine-nucleoside phosphorylase [Micavibrio aeruginosavorus]AGH98626.1 Purine nucleoside phosphorylase [Micavibrio aeruginosavorus EPB]
MSIFGRKKDNENLDIAIAESTNIILKHLNGMQPKIAVILGSGLGGVADAADVVATIPYTDLPGFPRPSVEGHAGTLIAGTIEGVPAIFLKGRAHLYEGVGPAPLKVMIRTMKTLGVEVLFLTNAAGSLRHEAPAGELIAIADQINFTGLNVLAGPNDDAWGPRFPPMDNAYDAELRATLFNAAAAIGTPLIEGTYAGFLGPTFETPAEIRMVKAMGADSVGMSTVSECIIARHCGLKVVGCSAITNMAAGMSEEALSHDQTIEWAAIAGQKLTKLVLRFISDWGVQKGLKKAA